MDSDPNGHLALLRVWQKQVRRHPSDLQILDNAAEHFTLDHKRLSEALYLRAQALDPRNSHWPGQLAHIYKLSARWDEDGAELAKRALMQRQLAIELSSPPEEKVYEIVEAVDEAFSARRFDLAAAYASELVLAAKAGFDEGNAQHKGHLMLGRLALRDGNVKAAGEHLLEAAETKGSAPLSSFGPNMALARELLEHGQRDIVLEYFDRCRRFWSCGGAELDRWAQQVRAGEIPDFGANMVY